jgi:hypothetical protein
MGMNTFVQFAFKWEQFTLEKAAYTPEFANHLELKPQYFRNASICSLKASQNCLYF